MTDQLGAKIDVLDHGFIRLVDHMGSDLNVVRSARVSYDAAWRTGTDEGSDSRLIKYLWSHNHSTPFESVQFTFEVKAPIFVFRQWHRHRTWSYNELSARYKELPTEYYLPDPDVIGTQSKSSKQARDVSLHDSETQSDLLEQRVKEVQELDEQCKNSFETYHRLIASGWPRELARSVLPVNTYSHMFASVNLLNLLRFITLRDHAHAQYEMVQYAKALKELVTPIVPVTMKAYNNID